MKTPVVQASQVIAVPGMTQDTVGCVTFWRLEGTIRRQDLELLWLAAGLLPEHLPPATSPASALARAVREQASKALFPRPLGRGEGWAFVREYPGEEVPEYSVSTRVVLVDGQPQVQDRTTAAGWLTDESGRLQQEIARSYSAHLGTLSGTDVSTWLVARAQALGAVALRDTGGIYFIPRQNVASWQAVTTVLRSCSSHHVAEIPALRSDEAVEAVMDAVVQEVNRASVQAGEDLCNHDLGSRALESRVKAMSDLATKVERYGDLLGRGVTEITDRLDALRAQLAEAAMTARFRAEEEKEAQK